MKNILLFLVLFNFSFLHAQSGKYDYPLKPNVLLNMENELCKPIDGNSNRIASNKEYWVLDSIVIATNLSIGLHSRVVSFKYDSVGNEIETADISDLYPVNWWKGEFSYNQMNRITKMIIYQGYDTISNAFIPYMKILYHYNIDGSLKYHNWFYWNAQQQKYMGAAGEYRYYYDSYKRLIKKVISHNTTGSMIFTNKRLYAYDQYGNLWLDRSYSWKSGSWQIFDRKERNYIGKDSLHWEIYRHYDLYNNNSSIGMKTIYYRDANQKIVNSKSYEYNDTTQSFDTAYCCFTTYNIEGKPILQKKWRDGQLIKKTIYSYDFFDNLVTTADYNLFSLPNGSSELKLGYKIDIFLNYYISSDDILLPKYFVWTELSISLSEVKRTHLLDHYANLLSNDFNGPNTTVDYGRYYYSQKNIVGINSQKKPSEIQVYPNPVKNQFKIKGLVEGKKYQLRLYDMQGRIVMRRNLMLGDIIDTESLKSGVYILKIIDKQTVNTGKLILQ